MKDTFNAATGYLEKSRRIQSKEQCYCTFSNLVLKGKLCKAVKFFCAQETAGVFQPNKLEEYQTDIINKTNTSVLSGKHLHKKLASCVAL